MGCASARLRVGGRAHATAADGRRRGARRRRRARVVTCPTEGVLRPRAVRRQRGAQRRDVGEVHLNPHPHPDPSPNPTLLKVLRVQRGPSLDALGGHGRHGRESESAKGDGLTRHTMHICSCMRDGMREPNMMGARGTWPRLHAHAHVCACANQSQMHMQIWVSCSCAHISSPIRVRVSRP